MPRRGHLIRPQLSAAAAAQALALMVMGVRGIVLGWSSSSVGAVAQALHVLGLEGLEDEILSTGC